MYETRSNRVGCFATSDFHAGHQNGQFLTSQAGLVWSSLASLKLCCWVCPNEGRLFWDYGKGLLQMSSSTAEKTGPNLAQWHYLYSR